MRHEKSRKSPRSIEREFESMLERDEIDVGRAKSMIKNIYAPAIAQDTENFQLRLKQTSNHAGSARDSVYFWKTLIFFFLCGPGAGEKT